MRHSRFNTLAFSVILAGSAGLVLLSTPARSQLGVAKGYVNLQATSPGTAQSGHANVSGTMRAANFVGSGAGLHSISGDSITTGVVSGEFLPDAVAMEDEGNTFTQPNTFNGTATFNGTSRFFGFASVGRSGGPINGQELFGIGENGAGYQGMYTKAASSGKPFYGYAAGATTAWHYLDTASSSWNLNVGNTEKLRVNGNGVGINGAPPASTYYSLYFVGVSRFDGNNGGPDGIINAYQSGTGSGIQSIAYGTGGVGVLARSGGNPQSWGLYADHTGNGDGVAAYGYGWGTTSTGMFGLGGSLGVLGRAGSPGGIGVRGESGSYWAVSGISTSSHGVVGQSAQVEGVVGLTSAATRHAVHGWTDTPSANGAFFATVAASGTGVGVIGQSLSPAGYGVQALGRFTASGTKTFRIDHPLDPENKFLNHYCAEGPEPLNVYSGEITTGNDGYAWIELPEYFSEINRNPRVQLTVDDSSDDFVMAKVVGGVKGTGVRIRTSKPNVLVYWEVKAVRNDKFVERYGAPVETMKTDLERGRYLHPELYDQPESKSMFKSSGKEIRDAKFVSPKTPARLPLPERQAAHQTTGQRK